jgi:hypothetical protein
MTYEQIRSTLDGLNFAIKADDGRVIAWAYSEGMAKDVCFSMNNLWTASDGTPRCSTCDPGEAEPCEWDSDIEGFMTGCGKMYCGHPNRHSFDGIYCPGCGGVIKLTD